MRTENLGLLLWGGVGTGKSFLAGCIANALMAQEVPVSMTNFARILNELNSSFSGRNEVVDRLCRYPLLIIDDFAIFDFDIFDGSVSLLINSPEQIVCEKLKSLLIFGIRSTRYKDIFDFYYLSKSKLLFLHLLFLILLFHLLFLQCLLLMILF